jgi:hypothetical protein
VDVPTITMPKEKALEKLKAYRADLHKDTEEVYRQAAEGYKALAEGTPLIHLDKAIQAGGFFPDMLPKLAIAPADRREVRFDWHMGTFASYSTQLGGQGPRSERLERRVNMGREHGSQSPFGIYGFTLVPMVPADVRPATGQLRDWYILWEVEQWTKNRQTPRAPGDPLLLRHIGGSLYAVLAQWDLTPLEQAILEGAMRS